MMNFKSKVGIVDRKDELEDWINHLHRYRVMDLPMSLELKICKDLDYFWSNDLISCSDLFTTKERILVPHCI